MVAFFRADTACCHGIVSSKWFLVCHEREKEENSWKDLSSTNNVSNLCVEWRICALLILVFSLLVYPTILISKFILEGRAWTILSLCFDITLSPSQARSFTESILRNLCHGILSRHLVCKQFSSQILWPSIEASLTFCARDTDHESRVPLQTSNLTHFPR